MRVAGILAVSFLICSLLLGQTMPAPNPGIALGGVAITPDGVVEMRQGLRRPRRAGDPGVAYVSLGRVIGELKALNGAPASKDLRYLKGITRIEYVFVYDGAGGTEKDLVIAGPSEPVDDVNPLQPTGQITGRPIVQLEDLIVALRAVAAAKAPGGGGGKGPAMFGCSLDMAGDAQSIADTVGKRFANGTRAEVAAELKIALGPQQVRIFGVPADSRLALAMVTADYRLKRMCIGLDPVPGVGNALSSGLAANRVWFEPAYDPIGVSDDGLSYHLGGPRLKVLAGPQQFNAAGATPAAEDFAKRFSAKMEDAAKTMPALADLQNVTDMLVVATLIQRDKLAEKAGVDLSWVLADKNYKVASLTVPKTAETMVSDTGSVIAQGGVSLVLGTLEKLERGKDEKVAESRGRPADGWFWVKGK